MNFKKKEICDFKVEGDSLDHIAEMNMITIAEKLDMSYDFFIKRNMCALDWRLNYLDWRLEIQISQPLQTNIKQFKIAVTFLTG